MVRVTKKLISCSVVLAFLLLVPFQAMATVSCTLDDVYTGPNPLGSAPWLKAVFTDASPGHVLLTLTALNLQQGEYVSNWYFNFNPLKNVNNLTFAYVSGIQPSAYLRDANDINADGVHGFDFRITEHSDDFSSGATTVLNIDGISGLTAADFNALLSYHGDTYLAAAHIEDIPIYDRWGHKCDTDDAYIGASAADPVPEPATLLLGSLGLGLLAMARKNKGNKG